MEVSRVRDGKKFVIKVVDKHLLRTISELPGLLEVLLEFYAIGDDLIKDAQLDFLRPDKIFEDEDCMYFVFRWYDFISSGKNMTGDMKSAVKSAFQEMNYVDAELNWDCIEIGRPRDSEQRMACIIDLGGMAAGRPEEALFKDATTQSPGSQSRYTSTKEDNIYEQGMYSCVANLKKAVINKEYSKGYTVYWPEGSH